MSGPNYRDTQSLDERSWNMILLVYLYFAVCEILVIPLYAGLGTIYNTSSIRISQTVYTYLG